MVHAIEMLKCNKGHILPISFDENNCGCHSKGKPCIIITCEQCFKEFMESVKSGKELKSSKEYNILNIEIPLDEDGLKEIKKLLGKEEKE